MTNDIRKCLVLTLAELEMSLNVISPIPTWMKIVIFVGVILVFLPDEIEITI